MSLMQELLSNPSHDYRALKYGDVIDGGLDADQIYGEAGEDELIVRMSRALW